MRNSDCGTTSAIASRCFDGGDGDGDQFVGFLFDRCQLRCSNDWDSSSNSSQNKVSSPSSSTMPILAVKSASISRAGSAIVSRNRCAERTICDASARPAVVFGSASTTSRSEAQTPLCAFSNRAHSAFRIPSSAFIFLGSDFEGVDCAGGISCSGIGFTGIPGCNSCRRVETTFSPSLSPLFHDAFAFEHAAGLKSGGVRS